MKRLRFVGASKEDLSRFVESVRSRVGHELFLVQCGRDPADWKPMQGIGSGVREIRVRDVSGAYRVIYVAKFSNAVYVLHAFAKKTQQTSSLDLELTKQRYKQAQLLAKEV